MSTASGNGPFEKVTIHDQIWLFDQWFLRSDGWEHCQSTTPVGYVTEEAIDKYREGGWTVTKYVKVDELVPGSRDVRQRVHDAGLFMADLPSAEWVAFVDGILKGDTGVDIRGTVSD